MFIRPVGIIGSARGSAALLFDFTGATLDGASLSRSTAANYWSATPDVDAAAIDEAIFEYSIDGTQLLGLRVDPTNTNLISANRDLSGWDLTTASVGAVVGVDGAGTPASTLTATSANATVYKTITGLTSGVTYTFSAYVKRRTGTGRVDITGDGGTTLQEISAYLLGSLWQKVFVTFVASGTSATVGFKITANGDALDVDDCRLDDGPLAYGPLLAGGTCAGEALFFPNVDGGGYGYAFDAADWPAVPLRGRLYIESMTFTSLVAGTSATGTMTYRTDEPGSPQYVDQIPGLALSLPGGTFVISGTTIVSGTVIWH